MSSAEALEKSLLPVHVGRGIGATGDVSQTLVTRTEEFIGNHSPTLVVGAGDRARAGTGRIAIEQHDRNAALQHLAGHLRTERGGDDDQTVNLVGEHFGQQHIHIVACARREQQHPPAQLVQALGERLEHDRKERVGHIAGNHTDDLRALRAQAAGDGVGFVAQVARHFKHPFTGHIGEPRVAAEDPRDGGL